MWLRFHQRFDWNVPGRHGVTLAYPVGGPFNVTRACAKAAQAAGVAEKVPTPPRGSRDDPAG